MLVLTLILLLVGTLFELLALLVVLEGVVVVCKGGATYSENPIKASRVAKESSSSPPGISFILSFEEDGIGVSLDLVVTCFSLLLLVVVSPASGREEVTGTVVIVLPAFNDADVCTLLLDVEICVRAFILPLFTE